ncbi:hypothetical protein [Chthonobacter albigriseus]|uniref:hypothetical protein n=1 Tax=Chthonobacter albigriseus TaxID=1683161 RepID=UPI0015EF554C|nr:hypothetical protein [Chthonobacter albigriseus]
MPARPLRSLILAPLALLLGGAAVPPTEARFLERFSGAWSGAGVVHRNAESGPQKVNCRLSGERSENRISIAGTCRAYLVFSRKISAEITYDPASRQYSGTYVGSRVGPASLAGKRRGDTVNLAVRWPRPVNGDRTARMRIVNDGAGSLRIVVTDDYGEGETTVTDVALARAG